MFTDNKVHSETVLHLSLSYSNVKCFQDSISLHYRIPYVQPGEAVACSQ